MAHPLMMPYLSGNVYKVCFGTLKSNCRDVCDLTLEFGHINIMCDIPSNYGLLFCEV